MSESSDPFLALSDVRFGFPSRPDFLGPIDWQVPRGSFQAVLGPNGAGKSTLLRLIAGLLTPVGGSINLDGAPIHEMPMRDRARRIAFVPQSVMAPPNATAREVVLLGRYPHRATALFESADDHRVADQSMAMTHTLDFADRPMRTLSGGEAQRVHVAAALAQDTPLLLLDEPTSSLDVHHQLAILDILRSAATQSGKTILLVTHDVNLACAFSDAALLLHEGKVIAMGDPADVLTPERMQSIYGTQFERLTSSSTGKAGWLVPVRGNR